jgi:hypothetical protein
MIQVMQATDKQRLKIYNGQVITTMGIIADGTVLMDNGMIVFDKTFVI